MIPPVSAAAVVVDALEFAAFIGEEAPLILALFQARKVGATSGALVAAIRASTLAGSDQAMRDELAKGGP